MLLRRKMAQDGVGMNFNFRNSSRPHFRPSARIAPGFGLVALTLRNGGRVEGVLHEETGTMVTVEDGANVRHRLETATIVSRTNLPSAMPPMGAILTPAEVRDVVEYLGTLK
jgi:putative heme-binding domain-containing protein